MRLLEAIRILGLEKKTRFYQASSSEMFGKVRYQKIIRENCQKSAAEILDAVYRELNEFTFGKKSEDDITLVIVKLNDP